MPNQAVEATLAAWIAAFNSGASTARYFTDDATLVRGNGVFAGSATIDAMEQRESKAGLRITLEVERVEQLASDVVWSFGRYKLTVPGKDGAPAQEIPGAAVHALRRQGDAWQMQMASFTRIQAPTPAPRSAADAQRVAAR